MHKICRLALQGLRNNNPSPKRGRLRNTFKSTKTKGLGQKDIQWYLDFFKYGVPPHGGWGFGGARFIMKLLGLKSIREAMFIYRGVNHINP